MHSLLIIWYYFTTCLIHILVIESIPLTTSGSEKRSNFSTIVNSAYNDKFLNKKLLKRDKNIVHFFYTNFYKELKNYNNSMQNTNNFLFANKNNKKPPKLLSRIKRAISSPVKNNINVNESISEIEPIDFEKFLNSSPWGENKSITLLGLLNLNHMSLNNDSSGVARPKYEITFRVLPRVSKIYREIETQYENRFIENFDYKTLDKSYVTESTQSWSDNIVTPQTLISNTSEVDVSEGNDTIEYLIQRFKEAYPVELWKQYGWFTDDFLYVINEHWLQFPSQTKEAHYILAFIYLFVLAAGIFGNLLVIFMFFRCRSLRTPANILVVNLAFSDLLMMTELPMLVYNSIFEGPALGQTACTIYGFIGGLTGTVSIGTLTAIAFDRYSVVVYPLDPLRAITGLRAKLSVVFVWVYGIFFSTIPALDLGLGKYVPEGFLTSCSFDYLSDEEDPKIFIFAFFIAAWVLPLLIITFCYAKIIHVVIITRNLGKEAAGNMSTRHCKENEKRKTELKLAGVVICVIGLFFAAWTPYAVVSLLGIMGYKNLLEPIHSMVPAMCAKLASCLDPFVYIGTHPKFRQECENLFLPKSRQRKSTIRQGWSENHPNQSVKTLGRDMDLSSENDVEVFEMEKVKRGTYSKCEGSVSDEYITSNSGPLNNKRGRSLATISPVKENIKTVSSHVVSKGIDGSELPRSLEENEELKPPSWYVKPEFARTTSVKNVVKQIQRLTSSDSMITS